MKVEIKRWGRLIRRCAFVAVTTFTLIYAGELLKIYDGTMKRWDRLYYMEKNSLDVLFMGSSHVYCTFIPDIFEESWGCSAFNLTSGNQNVIQTYYNLKEALRFQKPKVVVFDAYSLNNVDNWQPSNDFNSFKILNLDGMRMGKVKMEAVKAQMLPENVIKYYAVISRTHANWEDFKNIRTQLKRKFHHSVDEDYKGYDGVKAEMTPETRRGYKQMEGIPEEYEICDNQKKHFDMMAQLCRDNDIRLVVVMAPILKEWRQHTDYESRHRQIKEMTDKNGVFFLDYNFIYDRLGLNFHYFRNDVNSQKGNVHLNDKGAMVISEDFAQRMVWLTYDIHGENKEE